MGTEEVIGRCVNYNRKIKNKKINMGVGGGVK
jgi:hypothetical protein